MRSRKTEREALKKVISQPSEDIEDVLNEGVTAVLTSFMESREFYVVGMDTGEGSTGLFGPYLSLTEAKKALSGLVSPGPGPVKAGIWKLYGMPPS